MTFDMKKWLDINVIPLTHKDPKSYLYSFLWNGNPPKEILVWLMVGSAPPAEGAGQPQTVLAPDAWPKAAKRMLEEDSFYFDFTREVQLVRMDNGQVVSIFGGDGAPLYNPDGVAALRLFKKVGDISLIIQLGCKYPDGQQAAAATKGFYSMFEKEPMEVVASYSAPWGAA